MRRRLLGIARRFAGAERDRHRSSGAAIPGSTPDGPAVALAGAIARPRAGAHARTTVALRRAIPVGDPHRPTDDPRVAGVLVLPGDVIVPGILGTNIIDQTGSDAPWIPFLPARAVSIGVGVPVVIRFGDGSPIGPWAVRLARAVDRYAMTVIGLGSRESDLPPLDSVEPQPLPAGCWVLAASLDRSDRRGGGVTCWSLSVTP